MIDLLGLHVVDEVGQLLTRREVSVVEIEARARTVRVLINMVDPIGVECAGTPDDPVNFIALAEQQFSKVGTVLTGDTSDECALRHECLLRTADFLFLFDFV
jgi:hypothetical protein